ncbi:hypothetical protein Moror_5943 [Moniliophthora roreri MCA 2997]|uniref:Uncharacterized protein n=1 Tax=Moniliophthora roreri (strain MCA 2997) TaxID=1381753 RepID=V2WUV6_MONRO|nr:hypothetical protein Moror_5943 [Moniliophthora roreri MCA 2997]
MYKNNSDAVIREGTFTNVDGNQYHDNNTHYDNRQYTSNNHGGTQNNNNGDGNQTNYNGNWPMYDAMPIWPFILLAIGLYVCSWL